MLCSRKSTSAHVSSLAVTQTLSLDSMLRPRRRQGQPPTQSGRCHRQLGMQLTQGALGWPAWAHNLRTVSNVHPVHRVWPPHLGGRGALAAVTTKPAAQQRGKGRRNRESVCLPCLTPAHPAPPYVIIRGSALFGHADSPSKAPHLPLTGTPFRSLCCACGRAASSGFSKS
jgi:hypothetical protein